jgi:hypothetical protein
MPFTQLLARDGFNRADTANIDGSSADGDDVPAAANGTWEQHPVEPGTIGIGSSEAESRSGVTADYALYTLDGSGCDPVAHAAETLLNFPSFDVPGTPCPCSPAGEGFYHGPGNPERYTSGGMEHWRLWFERPAAGTVITWETTWPTGIFWKLYYEVQGDGTTVKVYEDLTGHPTFGPFSHSLIQTFTARDACDFVEFAVINSHAFGAAWGGPGGGKSYGTASTVSGVPTVTYDDDGATLNTTDPASNCGAIAGENGYTEVAVRMDPTDETGYTLGAYFEHTAGSAPTVLLQLWAAVNASVASGLGYTLMQQYGPFTVAHADPKLLRAEITDDDIISVYWGGLLLFTFDIATDSCLDPVGPAPVIASGRPGMSFVISNNAYIRIQQFSVYGPGDLCTDWGAPGGPGSGGGGEGFGQGVRMPRSDGFGFEEDCLEAVSNGLGFDLVDHGSVFDGALWVPLPLCDDIVDPIGPPNIGEPEPGCDAFVPPPSTPVTPYTGERIFFCYNMPENGDTDPFDTTVWAMSGRSTLDRLAILRARGMHMFTSVGNYAKFFTGGQYDPDKMEAWIASFASLSSEFEDYASDDTWLGQIPFDDYQSAERWGIRIPETEVNRIGGIWKSTFDWGVRTILRNTPLNVHNVDPSATHPNIDWFYCQYVARYGNINTWMTGNKSLVTGWGHGQSLLWGWNFQNLNGRGVPATVDDIIDIGTLYADEALSAGIGGWKYETSFLTQARVDALTYVRNRQAANWP